MTFRDLLLYLLKKLAFTRKYTLVPKGEKTLVQIQSTVNNYFVAHKPKLSLKAPTSLHEDLPQNFKIDEASQIHQTFVIKADNYRVWGNRGAVITNDGFLFKEVSREFSDLNHSIFKQLKLAPVKYFNQTLAVLAAAGAEVYYHWMFDILPRIDLIKQSGQFEEIDYFILNYSGAKFQEETLARTGIELDKLLLSNNLWKFHIAAKNLIIPSLPSPNDQPSLAACLYLRSLFKAELNQHEHEGRLYIQRTQGRRILNEEELIPVLEKLNFKIIQLEAYSVAEQASLFSTAKVVIGPHGSGFANIVFCKPETIIIDIFSPFWVNPCFWILANHVNLNYSYLMSEPIEGEKLGENKGANILINLQKLELLFDRLCIQ